MRRRELLKAAAAATLTAGVAPRLGRGADRAKTLVEIAKFSQRDAEAYPRYEAHLEKLGKVAESLLLTVKILRRE